MIILKRIINFFLYSNLWIALCATSLIQETNWLFAHQLRFSYLAADVFFSTLFLYAIHRLIGVSIAEGFRKGRYLIIKKLERHIIVYAILSAIGMTYSFFHLSHSLQIAISLAAIPSLGYVLPVLGNKKRIRDIHLIKIFLVAVTWAYITILLPLFGSHHLTFATALPLFLERFFFIFAITLPFDIRDMKLDAYTKVKTIPGWLGVAKTKKLAYLLLLLTIPASFFSYANGIYSLSTWLSILVFYALTGIVVKASTPERHDYFFTGMVDGLMLIHFLVILYSPYWAS